MKQLTCEMCGSTDLLKQDGVFVCQSCGTKYSVEEAKKMMVEGTVDVSGSTVKVDRTGEIANRLNNIKNEFAKAHNATVKSMCIELLNIDPDNWQAIMYNGLAEGWESSIGNSKITIAANELVRAVEAIRKQYKHDDEYAENCIEIIQQFSRIVSAMISTCTKYASEQNDQAEEWSEKGRKERGPGRSIEYIQRSADIIRGIMETNETVYGEISRTILILHMTIINRLDDINQIENISISERFCDALRSGNEICKEYLFYTDDKTSDAYYPFAEYFELMETTVARKKADRIDRYWEEHPAEKAELDSKATEYQSKIDALPKSIDESDRELSSLQEKLDGEKGNVPAKAEIERLSEKQKNLEDQLSKLGLFKGKEKARIKEEISALEVQIGSLEGQIKPQVDEVKARYQPEIDSLKERIISLKSEKDKWEDKFKEVQDELTKDR